MSLKGWYKEICFNLFNCVKSSVGMLIDNIELIICDVFDPLIINEARDIFPSNNEESAEKKRNLLCCYILSRFFDDKKNQKDDKDSAVANVLINVKKEEDLLDHLNWIQN